MQVVVDVKHMQTNLVGVASQVLEIFPVSTYLKIWPNFPFRPWARSKNLINWNQFKKFMQVGIDVSCMHTNFVGCDLSGFGDFT